MMIICDLKIINVQTKRVVEEKNKKSINSTFSWATFVATQLSCAIFRP
jgi:hypothetical protein